ncbi:MAG: hypothetical protein A3D74_03635 [Candidatus Levybacteria bacterium RIFCSPHIGHO2_02_FULL_37_13]|nr:MAG: hypothetical protein A3D74_03635 [Candidatus Levybacteria bacterium RIFCSPHIGHO2_02_FULL_37_13]OGH30643.1 MAG: hypothetical protein A3E40_04000 [Candidatus Levybacteria bacterium RIFCSPHIGHO2_12_FULL_37_9]OGH39501.1 MAG: hypothetical protein A3B41_00605 [Candidatus Levybacteria bacterium RIFCSPLOWO2_01_FULL_37_26]
MPSKNLAIQTALAGDWQNATSINKALLNDNPNDIEALNRLAFAFTILGKIKQAKATYKKVLELDSLNPIAIRNMKRLTDTKTLSKNTNNQSIPYVRNTFLEETGKTKIIELFNLAQPRIIANLRIGQPLTTSIKRLKVFIHDIEKQYIGALPDDIGKRLIRFIKGGNQYETFVRSANNHSVVVFIKEKKRATRFKNQPSFLQNNDKPSVLNHSPRESEES